MFPTIRSPNSKSKNASPPAPHRQSPYPHHYTRAEIENNTHTRLVLGVETPSDGQFNTMSRRAFTEGNSCAGEGHAAKSSKSSNDAMLMPPYLYYNSDGVPSPQPDYNVSRSRSNGGGGSSVLLRSSSPQNNITHQPSKTNVGASSPTGYTTENRSMLGKPHSDVYKELQKRPPAEVNRQNRIANNTANFVFSSVDGQVNPLAEKWKPGKSPVAANHPHRGGTSPTKSHHGEVDHHHNHQSNNNQSSHNQSLSSPSSPSSPPPTTTRIDYCRWENNEVQALRDEAAACREKQQQTSYRLGIDKLAWASEARNYGSNLSENRKSTVLQAQQNREKSKYQKMASQFTLGSSDMVDKEMPIVEHTSPDGKIVAERCQMATLKQLDFKPFKVNPSDFRLVPPVVPPQKERFVLGYRGDVNRESVYQSSFTPTDFV